MKQDNKNMPYMAGYGSITKVFNKIISAATPDRFTNDFLSTKLGIKSSSARPVIPFLKRIGFLNSDGTPTDLYANFRNDTLRSGACAQSLKKGYSTLFEMNEFVYKLDDKDLKGLVVQATGYDKKDQRVSQIVGSFKSVKDFADFNNELSDEGDNIDSDDNGVSPTKMTVHPDSKKTKLNLGYTINLNLPTSTDPAVYNAIFKSLNEHILNS